MTSGRPTASSTFSRTSRLVTSSVWPRRISVPRIGWCSPSCRPTDPPRVAACASHAAAQSASWPTEGPPRGLAAHDVQFPPYEIRTLDNGLQVVAVLHHEQPMVSMRMIVRAGAALDPPGKAGLADLAASLLDQGTTTRTANQMNDLIDFIGGEMGAGAGTDLTFVNVVVMKDSFETGLDLL